MALAPRQSASQKPATRVARVSFPPPSPAEVPPNDEKRRKSREPEWYGWQTLLSDAASLAIVISQRNETGLIVGVVGYAAVPPIIHFAHRNYGEGVASLGMRLLAPPAGAILGLIGGGIACRGRDYYNCLALSTLSGIGVGVAGAIALDATLLSGQRPRRTSAAALRWRPVVMAGKNEARVGVAGTF
jgi:hypothetical protein